MKPSGVEWIGDIPEGWRVSRIGAEYSLTLGKMIESVPTTGKSLVPYVSAVNLKWGGLDASVQKEMYFSPSEMREYALKMGDVLITEGGSIGTTCAYRGEFGPCGIQNSVIRARGEDDAKNRYLVYWMEFVAHSGFLDTVCNRATIAHYTKEKVAHTPIVIPGNLSDVVGVLESSCGEIDSAVQQLNHQISILERYKSSLIHETVTKGLDRDVPTRPSGVEWIGEVPAHWHVRKLKHVSLMKTGQTPPSDRLEYYDGDVKWFTPGDLNDDVVSDSSRTISELAIHDGMAPLNPAGCVLMVGIGATAGKTGYTTVEGSTNQQITSLIADRSQLNSKYLFYMMRDCRQPLRDNALYTTLPIINNQFLGNWVIPVPPVQEQSQIADYLDARCSRIDRILDLKRRQVDVLRHRRQSLIYEYVTGKRRVGQEA